MEPGARYWFPAMRHGWGWGWGWPQTWEGWLVLMTYLTAVLMPAVLLPERAGGLGALLALAVETPLLLWVCFTKGEPPDDRAGVQCAAADRRYLPR